MAFEVQRFHISDLGVLGGSVSSEDQPDYKSSDSEHSEKAEERTRYSTHLIYQTNILTFITSVPRKK